MNKIIIIGLLVGFTLLGFCVGITWQYGQSANLIKKNDSRASESYLRCKHRTLGDSKCFDGLTIKAQEPYQVRVYEDGGYIVQYHESQETETGCLDWGLCND